MANAFFLTIERVDETNPELQLETAIKSHFKVISENIDNLAKEDPVNLIAKVQDEVGHAQLLYSAAKTLGKSREYSEPDWEEFKRVINGDGPCNKERLGVRRMAEERSRWVRQALLTPDAKHVTPLA